MISNELIYLDYNSTTPVDKRVMEAMLPYFSEYFGNASSKTHRAGWHAEQAVEKARRQVAQLINAIEQEIIFTSGATEAINLAIKGVFEAYHSKGNHIVTLQTEHSAVLDTCKALEKRGAIVSYLPVRRDGLVDIQELEDVITDKTILVVIMFANNETGVIQPVEEIGKIAHRKNSLFFCDATQAIGKVRVDVLIQEIDLLALSAHKFYGPKGIGALYVRRKNPRATLLAQQHGGGHERGLRSGTLNVPGIVGLGKACEIAQLEMDEDAARISLLRTTLEQRLQELDNVYINGSIKNRLPNTTHLCFMGTRADSLIAKLPNIALSMGSACTSALLEPSHVLKAMGLSNEQANASIRFSLGKQTTQEEVEKVVNQLKKAVG